MELFTFVQMHGAVTAPEHVDILPIGGAGATLETVAGWFSNFRGERAKCFKPADRQKLLAVAKQITNRGRAAERESAEL